MWRNAQTHSNMNMKNLNSTRKLDCRVEGGKQRITSITSTLANLFSNLCLLNSQSHPLPSFLDLRHRAELIIIHPWTIFFYDLSNGRPISFHSHLCPTLFLWRLHSCFQLGLIKRRHQQEIGGWKKERSWGIYTSLTNSDPDSPPSTTPDLTRLWSP